MFTLSRTQLSDMEDFVKQYIQAENAASGSIYDANANVTQKNVTTLLGEFVKPFFLQYNRYIRQNKITELFGEEISKQYLEDIKKVNVYVHDETHTLIPYSYSARESITVKYKGNRLLISFDHLYDIVDEKETKLEDGVFGKFPEELYVYDKNHQFVKVSRIVKKKRQHGIVRVKTAFGEDLYVTDNHPMIVNENIDDTIPAGECAGYKQLKVSPKIVFKNESCLKIDTVFKNIKNYGEYTLSDTLHENIHAIKSQVPLSEEFGYFVGFFIGDGHFNSHKSEVTITQNDPKILHELANILYRSTGITSKIYLEKLPPSHIKENRNPKYILVAKNIFLKKILTKYFGIGHFAQNKNLPINIFDTNEDFAKGVISGLIDSDGTCKNEFILIRLASRYCISQLQTLLRYFDIGVGASISIPKISESSYIKTAYPMFGITFADRNGTFTSSFKCRISSKESKPHRGLKYNPVGWVNISNVQKMNNEHFLAQNEYVYDITTTSKTFVCNNLLVHNCMAIGLFPFLQHGSKCIGGNTEKPQHLSSFCGGLINLVNQIAAQVAGAVAIPSLLVCFDYFARKDYGQNYLETHTHTIKQELEFLVYYLNEPSSGRNGQSVFWNLSIFDDNYLKSMYGKFKYPDETFSSVDFESVKTLQKFFLKWFNKERERSLLTFPVITVAMIYDKHKKVVDTEFKDFICDELANGNSFFIYLSDSVDSLSSCCRLRSETKNEFSYTLGNVGEMTGSIHVITMNLNRIVQNAAKKHLNLETTIREQVQRIHKYHMAVRNIFQEIQKNHMYSAYDANFISMDKQYSTIGLLGMVEAAEFLGMEITPNEKYMDFCASILKIISEENQKARKEYGVLFNTEFVPGENAGHKLAQWDKRDGYQVNRDVYNSYFYRVEDENLDIIEKAKMHSSLVTRYLDGGSAVHYNLEEYLTKEQYAKWIDVNAHLGVSYFCSNIMITCCEEEGCGYIDKRTLHQCSKCGSKNISHATRIIGFLKKIKNFSKARQIEAGLRFYHKDDLL